jgi:hypothetical protein
MLTFFRAIDDVVTSLFPTRGRVDSVQPDTTENGFTGLTIEWQT